MSRLSLTRALRHPLLFLVAILFLAGCSLLRLQEDESERRDSFYVIGFVENLSPESRIIAFGVDTETGKIGDFDILEEGGSFVLSLQRGSYRVFAFEDVNRDSAFNEGECLSGTGDSILVNGENIHSYTRIELDLREKSVTCPYDISRMFFVDNGEILFRKLQTGAVVDLDIRLFDDKYVRQGLWTPFRAFKEHGAKIYFLEKYDPKRQPVLFIHGLNGSPRDLDFLIRNLDRSRFQPWVYYYPTGQRLDKSAHALFLELLTLQSRYGNFSLDIVGYSLGGLVGKRFLDLHAHHINPVDHFVSIATPWGGHQRAADGVRQLTVPIPVWLSLVPDGDEINSIATTPFPKATRFHLICSSARSRSDSSQNSDGFVPLESIRDPRIMSQADKTYTVDESHASIVRSTEVAALLDAIVAQRIPHPEYQF